MQIKVADSGTHRICAWYAVTTDIRRLAEFEHDAEFNNAELRRDEVQRGPYTIGTINVVEPAISPRLRPTLLQTTATPNAKRTIGGIIGRRRSRCLYREGRVMSALSRRSDLLRSGHSSRVVFARGERTLSARGRKRGGAILKTARLIDGRHLKGK